MTIGGMCETHMVLNCPLCGKTESTPVTPLSPTPAPVHLTDKLQPPEPPPKPELTDPKAKLALELAQAYEEVGGLQKLFDATKTALTEAKAKRDRIQGELFPAIIEAK